MNNKDDIKNTKKSILEGFYKFYDTSCGDFNLAVDNIRGCIQNPDEDKLSNFIAEYAEENSITICEDGCYFENAEFYLREAMINYNISVLFMHAQARYNELDSAENIKSDLGALQKKLRDISEEISKLQDKIAKSGLKGFY